MMINDTKRVGLDSSSENNWPNINLGLLCAAAFMMTTGIHCNWVALPFVIKLMGGSDSEVGLCFSANMCVYIFSCILVSGILDKFNSKRILLFSSGMNIVFMGLLLFVISRAVSGNALPKSILMLILIMGGQGIGMAGFWSPLMGWVSTGYEGKRLNRRLGFFCISWSISAVLAPFVGGYLFEINNILPIAVSFGAVIFCMAAIGFTRCPREMNRRYQQQSLDKRIELHPDMSRFRWLGRLGLFATFLCAGVIRSQLGMLFKFELGFTESVYGNSIAIVCLGNFVVFMVMGKTHRWHHNIGLFILSQLAQAIGLLIIICSKNLASLFVGVGLTGLCLGYCYSSHLYYGVSGGRKRSALMSIHEIILSGGFAVGSLFSGYLSDTFDRYMPYKFALTMVLVFGIVEIFVWFALRPQQGKSSLSTSPT